MENFHFELNSEQQKAVNDVDGAILVIAGAGSGKTRVLTARICHLIELGVNPYNILAITFTNKAANEMKSRIEQSIGYSNIWASTFHSMCVKILRCEISALGYTSDFSIYADDDQESVIKRILKNYGVDGKTKGDYLWHISKAKSRMLSPQSYYEIIKNDYGNSKMIKDVYMDYESELKKNNALDFDDLLNKTYELFKNFPDVLEKYSKRFMYIHVDEFQDTNKTQYELVKMLSSYHKNIFVVGDEDQNIYSWRGAEIKNILNFDKDFKDVKVYKLEQNYRSTTEILEAANRVIEHNLDRNPKKLWTDVKENYRVEYFEARDDRDEAAKVVQSIDIYNRSGVPYKNNAVLVRSMYLTRPIEENLAIHGIPYKVFGGIRFYDRKEIKDVLAYIRVILNRFDNESIMRTINYPARGIGDTTKAALLQLSDDFQVPVYDIIMSDKYLSPKLANKIQSYVDIIKSLEDNYSSMGIAEFVQFATIVSGIRKALNDDLKVDDNEARLENLDELVVAANEYEKDNAGATVSDFIQSVSLITTDDHVDDGNYVTVATIHSVKGLEFENVYIVGADEEVFPSYHSIQDNSIEEERRLMYVAITRAKRRLLVTNCKQRFKFGHYESMTPSRFIYEMSGRRRSYQASGISRYDDQRSYKDVKFLDDVNQDYNNSRYDLTPVSRSNVSFRETVPKEITKSDEDYSMFKPGVKVSHNKYGTGTVIEVKPLGGGDVQASIAFEGLGVKAFTLSIAKKFFKIIG